jgi:hypothetical protein
MILAVSVVDAANSRPAKIVRILPAQRAFRGLSANQARFSKYVGLMLRQIGLIQPRPQNLCQIAQHDRFLGRFANAEKRMGR